MKLCAIIAVLVTSILLLSGESNAQNSPSPGSAIRRERISQVISSRLEQGVQFTVAHGAAVLVEFEPNPYDIVDFAVYSDGNGLIWFDYGEATAKDCRKLSGSLEQVGIASCVAFVRWTAVENGLRSTFASPPTAARSRKPSRTSGAGTGSGLASRQAGFGRRTVRLGAERDALPPGRSS